jgi:hypothetical protein
MKITDTHNRLWYCYTTNSKVDTREHYITSRDRKRVLFLILEKNLGEAISRSAIFHINAERVYIM